MASPRSPQLRTPKLRTLRLRPPQLRALKLRTLIAPSLLLLLLLAGPAAWLYSTTTQKPAARVAGTHAAQSSGARDGRADDRVATDDVRANDAAAIRAAASFGKLPLGFEANAGQFDGSVRFTARGDGYAVFLTADEAVLALRRRGAESDTGSVLRMKLLDANRAPRVAGRDALPGRVNHFVGRDPSRWRADVPAYARVEYEDVYPGISLAYYGRQRQLEYDFIVAPGADVNRIRLAFSGADSLEVDGGGDLVLKVAGAEVRQLRPFAYQEDEGGARREVASRYVVRPGGEVGFELGDYDAARPVVIDPVFVFSTFLGGSDVDSAFGIAVDAERNVYVTGHAWSADFPVANPAFAQKRGFADIFVAKLNPQGTALVYSTFVGASMGDIGAAIDVDDAGSAYVCGTSTLGEDFPLVNPFNADASGYDDAVVFKLSPAGNALVYSTYLSLSYPQDIAVNRRTGEATVVGLAGDPHPTTPGAFQTTPPGPAAFRAGYVTRFSPEGNTLRWSTYYHGFAITSLVLDADDNVYLTGSANVPFEATPGAAQPACNSCFRPEREPDVGIAKLNSTGSAVVFATWLGGSRTDGGGGIAIDAARNVYVTGQTQSGSDNFVPFPTTPGAFQTTSQGIPDAFVAKLSADGTTFLYSTYLGGNVRDQGLGIAADAQGYAHVTGSTRSMNFPLVAQLTPSFTGSGNTDAFVTTLNPSGSAPVFSTTLGGISLDEGFDIVTDNEGNVYVAGQTYSTSFPTTPGAFQTDADAPGPAEGGVGDAFITKIHVYDVAQAGDVIISEFRLSGSGGARDEFVELYNRTNNDITVQSVDGSAGWSLAGSDGAVRATIPAGTKIRARGHYLLTNGAGYSLAGYRAGDDGAQTVTAAGDLEYAADIPDGGGVALFRTANPANFTAANRLDAAGYSTAPALYREGAGLPAGGIELAWPVEHSHARDLSAGAPRDTNDNAADFITLDTHGGPDPVCGPTESPSCPPRAHRLGAPGPQNSQSQPTRNAQLKASLVDPSCDGTGTPNAGCQNLVRDASDTDALVRPQGTFTIRRRFTNMTGLPVTSLRFRVADLTTLFSPGYDNAGQSDLRAITSADTFVTTTNGARVPVAGTTLEQPPSQESGGGYNSTLSVGGVTLAEPLAPGASVNVQFHLGVARPGTFRFFVNVEATTAAPADSAAAAAATRKHDAARRKTPRRRTALDD